MTAGCPLSLVLWNKQTRQLRSAEQTHTHSDPPCVLCSLPCACASQPGRQCHSEASLQRHQDFCSWVYQWCPAAPRSTYRRAPFPQRFSESPVKQEQRKTKRLTEIWIWRFGWPHTKPCKPYRCHYNFPFSGEAQTTACQNLWVHFPHFNTTFSLDMLINMLGMLINPNKVCFLHLHDEHCLFRGILISFTACTQ